MKKYTHIPGHCPICNDQIFDFCNTCKRAGLPLPNQRQFLVTLENGNQTWLGICVKHVEQMSVARADAILRGIMEATGAEPTKVTAIHMETIEAPGQPGSGEIRVRLSLWRRLRNALRWL